MNKRYVSLILAVLFIGSMCFVGIESTNAINTQSALNVYKTKPQLIPRLQWNKLNLNTIQFDRLNEWDLVNNKFVAKTDGIYATEFHVATPAATNNVLWVMIKKNGSQEIAQGVEHQIKDGVCAWSKCFALIDMVVGDYLEVFVYHDVYSSIDLTNGIKHTGLQVWKVSE